MAINQAPMKSAVLLLVIAPPIFCGDYAPAQTTQEKGLAVLAKDGVPAEQSVRELIQQLGDPFYDKREAASSRLTAIGAPAWDLIRAAGSQAADAETRHRLKLLQRAIGKTLFTQVRQFEGHSEGKQPWVTRVVVTPDGRQTIVYENAAAKPQIPIYALAFTDEGKTLVCAGGSSVSWWDVATGKQRRAWNAFANETRTVDGQTQPKTFSHCVLSPDGKSLAVQVDWMLDARQFDGVRYEAIDYEAVGFDLPSGKVSWRAFGKGPPNDRNPLAFSADGKRVAISMEPLKVEVRDTATGKLVTDPLHAAFAGNVWYGGLALSSNGNRVALALGDSRAVVWDLAAGGGKPRPLVTRRASFRNQATLSLGFSPHDKTLLVGVDSELQLYDAATLKEVQPYPGHRGLNDYLAFSPDGRQLYTGSAAIEMRCQELAAWEVGSWKQTQLVSMATPPWSNVDIVAPNLSVYVGKSGDERFRLYDLADGKMLARFEVPRLQPFLARGFFSPSGKHYVLASQVDNKPVERLFAVPSGKELCALPPLTMMRTDGESARPIAFSSDEQLVAMLSRQDKAIHVCETATGKERHRFTLGLAQGAGARLAANIAFSSDSKLLATWIGSLYGQETFDSSIVVWDLATGKEALRVPVDPLFRIQFTWSPDSRVLAVTGRNGIRLWEISTIGVRRELAGHANVRALAFSPDGRLLATGSGDSTVLIWDIAMPEGLRAGTPLPVGELAKRWQTLAEDDAAPAYAAIRSLAAGANDSVAWIRDKVKAAPHIDAEHVEKLITQLNDDQFKVRQKATAELLTIGERVVLALDKALADNPTLETSLRLHDVRKRLTAMVLKGDRLQLFRAVEVLELIGTPEARQVLGALAKGAPGALATMQAQAALRRLQGVSGRN